MPARVPLSGTVTGWPALKEIVLQYRIRNWDKYQHYRDRNPPWIKLHFELLSSQDWVMLDDASRVLAIASMLIASKNDGLIDTSKAGATYLMRVAYLSSIPDFKPLINSGFLELASDCKQMLADARPETETETETEKRQSKNMSDKSDDVPSRLLKYLNTKTGKGFRAVESNLKLIRARLKEGISELDLKAVIDRKSAEWIGTKMEQYLRPETLFGATKCNQYVGELTKPSEAEESERKFREWIGDGGAIEGEVL